MVDQSSFFLLLPSQHPSLPACLVVTKMTGWTETRETLMDGGKRRRAIHSSLSLPSRLAILTPYMLMRPWCLCGCGCRCGCRRGCVFLSPFFLDVYCFLTVHRLACMPSPLPPYLSHAQTVDGCRGCGRPGVLLMPALQPGRPASHTLVDPPTTPSIHRMHTPTHPSFVMTIMHCIQCIFSAFSAHSTPTQTCTERPRESFLHAAGLPACLAC
mmetsp:Transcript_22830/g.56333  ORF Transcript_22830/g.56333 Transcript_22830/m.56333 type:complete len:213 (+) Transcript_22830:364-1002(+)